MSYLQTEKYNFTDFAPEVWLYAQTCTHTQAKTHTDSIYANGMYALFIDRRFSECHLF